MNAIPLLLFLLVVVPPIALLLWCDASSRGYLMSPDEPAPLIREIEAMPEEDA